MDQQTFSKKEVIRFGWRTVKENFLFFVGLLIIVLSIQVVLGQLSEFFKEDVSPVFFILVVISWLITFVISLGLIYIALRFVDGVKPKYKDLLTPIEHFLSFSVASILYGIIVVVGLLLLVIPGIIWSIKYGLFRYLIVDKGMGPIEALKKSAEITKGSKWNLFLLAVLLGLINILGVLAFIVGLFVTIPLSMIAAAYVYRKLLFTAGEKVEGAEEKQNDSSTDQASNPA